MERVFVPVLLFDHLSSEKAAGNAGTCAVRCCLSDGAEEAVLRKSYPGLSASEK